MFLVSGIFVSCAASPKSVLSMWRVAAVGRYLPFGFHSDVNITASVILMNSSFRSVATRAPRILSAISAAPRCLTQFESSMMEASSASWFSLILKSREGSRSELGITIPPRREKRSNLENTSVGLDDGSLTPRVLDSTTVPMIGTERGCLKFA